MIDWLSLISWGRKRFIRVYKEINAFMNLHPVLFVYSRNLAVCLQINGKQINMMIVHINQLFFKGSINSVNNKSTLKFMTILSLNSLL